MSQGLGPQIDTFLRRILAEVQPQRVITVERKGTALLRTLAESASGPGPDWVGWDCVISHDAVRFIRDDELQSGITLVLDDAIRSGRQARQLISYLTHERGVVESNLVVAAFAVHRQSHLVPQLRWFGQLDESAYRSVRAGMIHYFQQGGSLLLDTEHIEVPVRIHCPRVELFKALSRAGIAVEYVSGAGRVNLTIHDPVLLDEGDFLDRLPRGSLVEKTVRKIRVIHRAGPHYAIIPIFFPIIPAGDDPDSVEGLELPLPSLGGDAVRNFYLTGVFAAAHLLQTAMTAIRELVVDQKVWVENPRIGARDDRISHLKAVLPGIDVQSMHQLLQRKIADGLDKRSKTGRLRQPCLVEAGPGTAYGRRVHELRELILQEALFYSERSPQQPFSVTFRELRDSITRGVSERDAWIDEALMSAAIDTAIDAGELAANVAQADFADGIRRCVRVFDLDNEIARVEARRRSHVLRSNRRWSTRRREEVENRN